MNVLTKTRNDQKPPETAWNHLKPLETTWNHLKLPETTWKQLQYFLLKISYSQDEFVLILYPEVFLGKFCLKNWSSPNWLKFGTGVHCYILISNLMFIFPKFLSLTFFWANLVPKSEVLQINWNLVQGHIAIYLLRF